MVEAGLGAIPTAPPAAAKVVGTAGLATSTTAPSAEVALPAIAAAIATCQNCVLGAERQNSVPGEGNPDARLMFVGESPGAEEDRSGRPFVGAAGQLLEKILENGMGLTRAEVFITNLVKCRPPQNRDPLPQEVCACTPFLEQQIAAVNPELLIALGRPAAHHLLQTAAPISELRGKILKRPQDGLPILVTDHPALLLYEPARKADCWADIQVAMRFLGLTK